MPHQVRPFEIGVQSGAFERTTNHTANSALSQTAPRCFQTDKEPTCCARGTAVLQIMNQYQAHILGQRQSIQSPMSAAHDNLTVIPVHVIKGHSQHFATAQTEPGQKQQDGVITLTG
jgi:hypothetical protein